jgi:hypothetical protein
MMTRTAQCSCGQLRLTCRGEPAIVVMCHCLECQRRSGSAFGNAGWFARGDVAVEGKTTAYTRSSDSGRLVTVYFCPICGSTVYWTAEVRPTLVAVSVGAFADPDFPAPQRSVWEDRRHGWTDALLDLPLDHSASGTTA